MKLKHIDRLVDMLFSKRWQILPPDTRALSRIFEPGVAGVYILAYPDAGKELSERIVRSKDVYYVGMTNSKHGLRGRLKGFIRSANGKSKQHSGGVEFFQQNGNQPYLKTCYRRPIFFVTHSIKCCTIKTKSKAKDFYEMGNIACLEYYAVARVRETIGKVPPLNRSVGGILENS